MRDKEIEIWDVKDRIEAGLFQLIKKGDWILLEDNETGERVRIGEDVTIKRAYWRHSVKYQCENKQNEMLECSRCGYLFARAPGMLRPMKREKCKAEMENGEGRTAGESICMVTRMTCSKCTPGPCEHRRGTVSAEETDRG